MRFPECGTRAVSDARRKACLTTFIGDERKTVINNLSANQKDTFDHLKESLIAHFQASVNVTVQLHNMNQEN